MARSPDLPLEPLVRQDRERAQDETWAVLRQLMALARKPGFDPAHPTRLRVRSDGLLAPAGVGDCRWMWQPGRGWCAAHPIADPEARALVDLYLPLCGPDPQDGAAGAGPRGCRILGHLGQSLDGFIATANGDSCFVTGPENIRHLHRMRALSDGVLVGTETAASDDPRLTTRLVPGENPVRVILDRRRRLPARLRVFTDGAAETLLCCDRALVTPGRVRQGQARVLGVPCRAGRLDLAALREALASQGIRRVFVEGGGATVSAFLQAGLLDRLQIAVAPVLIGTGRPGLRIPPPDRLADACRPAVRLFRMGSDLLYDLDLRCADAAKVTTAVAAPTLARIL